MNIQVSFIDNIRAPAETIKCRRPVAGDILGQRCGKRDGQLNCNDYGMMEFHRSGLSSELLDGKQAVLQSGIELRPGD